MQREVDFWANVGYIAGIIFLNEYYPEGFDFAHKIIRLSIDVKPWRWFCWKRSFVKPFVAHHLEMGSKSSYKQASQVAMFSNGPLMYVYLDLSKSYIYQFICYACITNRYICCLKASIRSKMIDELTFELCLWTNILADNLHAPTVPTVLIRTKNTQFSK